MSGWIELKDLQAVAKAQADGWEIEVDNCHGHGHGFWQRAGCVWYEASKYRGRPKPVENKKIKFLAWRSEVGTLIHIDEATIRAWNTEKWKRIPNLDLEGEVE